jgi:competence protein ComEA
MFMGAIAALVIAAMYVLLRQKHTPDLLVQSDEGWQPDVRVAIAGEVATPGTYTLRGDARLSDLIAAAGGYTDRAERNAFNPAARLGDGQQYVIPTQISRTGVAASRTTAAPTDAVGMPATGIASSNSTSTPPVATPRATATTGRVNINSATKDELAALPAIGPVIAQRIIDDRAEHGPYAQVEDLERVRGISARTVEQLRDRITVGP